MNEHPSARTPWRKIALIYLVFFALAIGFTGLAREVVEAETLPFDTAILTAIHRIASPTLDQIFFFITNLAGAYMIAGATLVLTVAFYLRKETYNSIYVLLTLGGSLVLNTALKLFFKRVRPDLWSLLVVEKSYSFPSGHAMVSMALALTVIVLVYQSKARLAAITGGLIYVLLVGFSRLYLGVHYPTDVAGGWLMSCAWIFLATRFMFRNTAFREDTLT